jgi:hypothetical protein
MIDYWLASAFCLKTFETILFGQVAQREGGSQELYRNLSQTLEASLPLTAYQLCFVTEACHWAPLCWLWRPDEREDRGLGEVNLIYYIGPIPSAELGSCHLPRYQ